LQDTHEQQTPQLANHGSLALITDNDPPEWNTWDEAQLIRRQKQLSRDDSLEIAIERGKILHRLKLAPADYEKKNIGITARCGQMLVNLATSPRTYANWPHPASWRAVYEIVKYDGE
jgi:hypothetical protein